MTTDPMATPVTRGELHQALELWGGALEQRLLRAMAAMGAQLTAQMDAKLGAMEQRLSAELARHSAAFAESTRSQIAVVDDKYKDLPGRVKRLEDGRAPKRTRAPRRS